MAEISNVPEEVVRWVTGRHPLVLADSRYWAYGGKYWAPLLDDDVMTWFTRILQPHSLYGTRKVKGLKDAPDTFEKYPVHVSDPGFGGALAAYIARSPEIRRPGFFDAAPRGLTVRNGFLRLNDNGLPELIECAPALASRYYLDTDYSPEAECPYTLEVLASYFVYDKHRDGPAKQRAILEFLALCLFGQANADGRGIMLCCTGPSGFGKSSILINLVDAVFDMHRSLGDAHGMVSNVDPHHFADPNERRKMVGRLINVKGEIEAKAIRDAGTAKTILSGEPISVKTLYENLGTARMRCGHLIMGNKMPLLADSSGAFQNRAVQIPFTHPYARKPEHQTAIARKIMAERAGILNKLCQVYREMLVRGNGTATLLVPESAKRLQLESTLDANTLGRFVQEICAFDGKTKTSLSAVFSVFTDWARLNGEAKNMNVNARMLADVVCEELPEVIRTRNTLLGIRLREPTVNAFEEEV
jgi:phage/plasmid-associated DNA primase